MNWKVMILFSKKLILGMKFDADGVNVVKKSKNYCEVLAQ